MLNLNYLVGIATFSGQVVISLFLTLTVKHKTVYLISVVTEVQKWVQFNIFKEVLMVVSMLMDRIGQWKVLKRESIHVH